jgi:2-oxoglutarate ferredoxin oxidoreductase subunit delta
MAPAAWKGVADMNPNEPIKRGKGTIFLRPEVCKGCSFCIDFCPPRCLEFSGDFNRKGYHFPVLARAEDCTGCDLCGLYCPDFAIFGVRYRDIEKTIVPAQQSAVAARA